MKHGWPRNLLRLAGGLALLWLVLSAALFTAMLQPPDRFGRIMAHVPGPAFALFAIVPFEPLWNLARGGDLGVGDPAPDFDLERVEVHGAPAAETGSRSRLSASFGHEPVVLVFGSFT